MPGSGRCKPPLVDKYCACSAQSILFSLALPHRKATPCQTARFLSQAAGFKLLCFCISLFLSCVLPSICIPAVRRAASCTFAAQRHLMDGPCPDRPTMYVAKFCRRSVSRSVHCVHRAEARTSQRLICPKTLFVSSVKVTPCPKIGISNVISNIAAHLVDQPCRPVHSLCGVMKQSFD